MSQAMNRKTFFDLLPPMSQRKRLKIQWAYRFAKTAHAEQSRDDGERYFEHVRRVALLLIEFGYLEFEIVILALLHDVLEDTYTALSMLEQLFGPTIARAVLTVSKSYCLEDPLTGNLVRTAKREPAEYFASIERNGRLPAIAKCVDRIDNLSDLIDPPEGSRWTPEKCLHQVTETREWILPLADMFDHQIAARLRTDCDRIEASAKKKLAAAATMALPLPDRNPGRFLFQAPTHAVFRNFRAMRYPTQNTDAPSVFASRSHQVSTLVMRRIPNWATASSKSSFATPRVLTNA